MGEVEVDAPQSLELDLQETLEICDKYNALVCKELVFELEALMAAFLALPGAWNAEGEYGN